MKKHIITLAAIALFCACSNDNQNSPLEDNNEITFTSGIESRATGNLWTGKDSIGVYMKETGKTLASATIIEKAANRKFITPESGASGKFTPAKDQNIYYPETGNVDFIAYYPYTKAVSSTFTLPVNVSVQQNLPAIDLLYSDNASNIKKSRESVAMTFKHKLSKIEFIIKPGDGLNDNDLKGIKITINGCKTKADFSLVTGKLSNETAPADIAVNVATNGKSGEAILLPRPAGNEVSFTFDLTNGGQYTTTPVDKAFTAGKKIVYTVTLRRAELGIDGTISQWESEFGDVDANQKPNNNN